PVLGKRNSSDSANRRHRVQQMVSQFGTVDFDKLFKMREEEAVAALRKWLETDAKEFDGGAEPWELLEQHVLHNQEKQNLRNEAKYYRDIAESRRREIKTLTEQK